MISDGLTDRRTDRQTFAIVESLSRLKIYTLSILNILVRGSLPRDCVSKATILSLNASMKLDVCGVVVKVVAGVVNVKGGVLI